MQQRFKVDAIKLYTNTFENIGEIHRFLGN